MEKEAFLEAMGQLWDDEFARAHMIFVDLASDRNITRNTVGDIDPHGAMYLKHKKWALLVPDASGMGCIVEDQDPATDEEYNADVGFEVVFDE